MGKATIRLIPGRMLLLRLALKKEEARLQETANQVARIAAGLDMELKSRESIDKNLEQIRKRLKQQAENMTTMVKLADLAEAELMSKDQDLAGKADSLMYTLRQMMERAGAAGGAGAGVLGDTGFSGITGFLSKQDSSKAMSLSKPALDLGAQMELDSTSNFSNLFSGLGDKLTDSIVSGVSLVGSGLFKVGSGELTAEERTNMLTGAAAFGATAVVGGITAMTGALDGVRDSISSKYDSWSREMQTRREAKITAEMDRLRELYSSEDYRKVIRSMPGGDVMLDEMDNLTDEELRKIAEDNLYNDDDEEEPKGFLESIGDKISDVGDSIAEFGEDCWENAKDFGSDVADWGADRWEDIKAVANSKPVEYLGDMGGSLVGGGADIGSFCWNVASGDWAAAAADVYSLSNNFTAMAQDANALLNYGLGAGLESVGWNEQAERYYAEAERQAGLNGVADEFHAAGLDGLGTIVDAADLGVGIYKTATGIGKLNASIDSMSWSSMSDVGKNLFSFSGWKSVDKLSDAAELSEQIKHYSDTASNVKLGYKYVDSLLSNGFLGGNGLPVTAIHNTSPAKIGIGIVNNAQGALDLFRTVLEADDKTTQTPKTSETSQ